MNTSKPIEYGGAVYTVTRSTVRSLLTSDVLLARLNKLIPVSDASEEGYRAVFCQIAAQVTSDKNAPVTFPTVASSDKELRAAWEAYLDIDSQLAQILAGALSEVNRPLNDERGLPKELLTQDAGTDPE